MPSALGLKLMQPYSLGNSRMRIQRLEIISFSCFWWLSQSRLKFHSSSLPVDLSWGQRMIWSLGKNRQHLFRQPAHFPLCKWPTFLWTSVTRSLHMTALFLNWLSCLFPPPSTVAMFLILRCYLFQCLGQFVISTQLCCRTPVSMYSGQNPISQTDQKSQSAISWLCHTWLPFLRLL